MIKNRESACISRQRKRQVSTTGLLDMLHVHVYVCMHELLNYLLYMHVVEAGGATRVYLLF